MTSPVQAPFDRTPVVDAVLMGKYQLDGSARYASYPLPDRFAPEFGPAEALEELKRLGESCDGGPVSLYVHLPFCESVCFYCECDAVATSDRTHAAEYLTYLEREIVTRRGALGRDEEVAQLHWGGTPTFLSIDEMTRLLDTLGRYFSFRADAEQLIEIDPRRVTPHVIERLGTLGFNHLSIGVQDFDPDVQRKLNGVQSIEQTARVVVAGRSSGFLSINLDLMYGLPAQSRDSFARTLDSVLQLRPDRIALYPYAHLPALFAPQRRIDAKDLPAPEESIRILEMAVHHLTVAGYIHLGMDHFALPDDDLAVGQLCGTLRWTLHGYSTHAERDSLSFGVSAISSVGKCYSQNHGKLSRYYESLERGELPVSRGHRLSADDALRAAVIQRLACNFRVSFAEFAERFGVDFASYFSQERETLTILERDGVVHLRSDGIEVTPRGRLLMRVICRVFDRYERQTRVAARGRPSPDPSQPRGALLGSENRDLPPPAGPELNRSG